MRDFRRSVIRLLVGTFFLLAVAWVSMKLIQNGGDADALLRECQRALYRWKDSVGAAAGKGLRFLQPIVKKLGPALESLSKTVRELFTSVFGRS